MRYHPLQDVLVGLFTLAMIFGIVVSAAKLTGQSNESVRYYALYNNVAGLKFGTQIFYEGFRVGQVEDIGLNTTQEPGRFLVNFSIHENIKMASDSLARIVVSGVLASATIDIRAGSNPKLLAANARMMSEEPVDVFGIIASVAKELKTVAAGGGQELMLSLKETMQSINGLVNHQGRSMLLNLEKVTNELNTKAPAILANLEIFSSRLQEISKGLETIINPKNVEQFNTAIDNTANAAKAMEALAIELQKSRNDLDHLLADTDQVMLRGGKDWEKTLQDSRRIMATMSYDMQTMMHHLQNSSRNMDEFSRRVRDNPSLLLNSQPPKERE